MSDEKKTAKDPKGLLSICLERLPEGAQAAAKPDRHEDIGRLFGGYCTSVERNNVTALFDGNGDVFAGKWEGHAVWNGLRFDRADRLDEWIEVGPADAGEMSARGRVRDDAGTAVFVTLYSTASWSPHISMYQNLDIGVVYAVPRAERLEDSVVVYYRSAVEDMRVEVLRFPVEAYPRLEYTF